ncbi:MAG: glycerophosphodiester phosphodiesterase family protein [Eubacteriales bacterium]|nr:glycerophosphodiester phosphodiesterase family protein [Eubacteriales bacterium]
MDIKETIKKHNETVRKTTKREWKKAKAFVIEVEKTVLLNLNSVILFLLVYALGANITFDSVSEIGKTVCMRNAGITYIGPDNIFEFFFNEYNFGVVLVLLLITLAMTVFFMSGLLHAFSMSKIGKKTTFTGMVIAGIKGCIRSLEPWNWPMLLLILFIMPLTGIFSISMDLLVLAIPGFVVEFIQANKLYNFLYNSVMLILIFIEALLVFSIPFFLLSKKYYSEACKKSFKLIKGRLFKTIVYIAIAGMLATVAVVCLSTIISKAANFCHNIYKGGNVGTVSQSYYTMLIYNMTNDLLKTILVPAVNIATLTVLFFEYIEEDRTMATLSIESFNDKKMPVVGIVALVSILVVVLARGVYIGRNFFDNFAEDSKRPTIVAHRGDSVRAPENTMPAFELAIIEGVEWVEFDVQQCKDGVVVVAHDDDLTRVSGKKLYVHEMTYAETQELDVGSWFDPEFSYIRLSTLDEVLKTFKDTDIKIQIEIKINGNEDHLEEAVLKVINDNDMHDRCIITSLNKEPLIRIKELDPDMITTYSMYVAWDGIENIDFSDYFTIEESNYTKELVDNIHAAGKKCFAWTVNSERTVQYLVDCGVDGILTDDPLMLDRALDLVDYDGGVIRGLRLLFMRFKGV